MELERIVKRFTQKDAHAFEQLYEMYYKSILGVVYNIVRDEAAAEEVTQDVFIKAWQNAHAYSSQKGRIFTWLLNIGRNAAIDKIRSKSFRQKSKNQDVEIFVDILKDHSDLDKSTDAIGIKSFVAKLADTCKKLIDLIYFRGYTQKEVSESLEMPLGTVKTKNRKCLNNLRAMLE